MKLRWSCTTDGQGSRGHGVGRNAKNLGRGAEPNTGESEEEQTSRLAVTHTGVLGGALFGHQLIRNRSTRSECDTLYIVY
jgi:hypothetical protein